MFGINFLDLFKYKYFNTNEFGDSKIAEIQKMFSKFTNRKLENIESEFICVFYDILMKIPCKYFDKDVFTKTIDKFDQLINDSKTIIISEEMIECYLMGLNTYEQITEVINDFSQLNFSSEIKNRQYRIPTYVSLAEGCLSNLYRFLAKLIDQTVNKDYSNMSLLYPLYEMLQSNGWDFVLGNLNVSIRNAINHGKVIFYENGKKLNFIYSSNRQLKNIELTEYEFENLINSIYDLSSSLILSITYFLNKYHSLIQLDLNEDCYLSYQYLSMKLSKPDIRFKSIYGLSDNKQLNMDIVVENYDRGFLSQLSFVLLSIVYSYHCDFKKYLIGISGERLQGGWFILTNDQIKGILEIKYEILDVYQKAIEDKNVMIWNPSTENIDLQEIKYFRFPNYVSDRYVINNISDSSLENRKRLRCSLFIGDVVDKKDILEIINNALDWLKQLKNVDSPTLHHKNGEMEADSIYMNVYRNDERTNKELLSNNSNFVCFVDYNVDGITLLVNGGLPEFVWKTLHHEKIGNSFISWREQRYCNKIKKKIGVNEPCPCGSGKKFKKCCKNKKIYD